MITTGDFDGADELLVEGNAIKSRISQIRHSQQDRIQREDSNIKVALLYLSTLQETRGIDEYFSSFAPCKQAFPGAIKF